jgi:hypothetical protein
MACTKILFGVEQALRELLGRVSEDYGLDYAELEARYFKDPDPSETFPESIASSPPPPVHRTVVAKPLAKPAAKPAAEAALCAGHTTKGAPCKKRALAGGCFCSVHAAKGEGEGEAPAAPKKKAAAKKKAEPVRALAEEETDESGSPPPAEKPKKAKKAAAKKTKEPPAVHDHPVGEEDGHSDCEGCAVHGRLEDPVDAIDGGEEEYEVRGSVRTRMMEMLSRVAAMEDEVVEEDE